MRSISFITIVVATAVLALPAAVQAESAAVHQISHRAVAGTEFLASVRTVAVKRRPRRVVLAATVRSVSRRTLTVDLADGRGVAIPTSSLGRGRLGRRVLATLQVGDRLLAMVRFRRDGSMRVRLVRLPAPGEDDPGYDPSDYDGGQYEGGQYEGGDYEDGDSQDGDYEPGPDDSEGNRDPGRPRG